MLVGCLKMTRNLYRLCKTRNQSLAPHTRKRTQNLCFFRQKLYHHHHSSRTPRLLDLHEGTVLVSLFVPFLFLYDGHPNACWRPHCIKKEALKPKRIDSSLGFLEAHHSGALCFTGLSLSSCKNYLSCERRGLTISAFACPTLCSAPRSIVKGKAAANNNAVVSEDDPLVVCFGEMSIDFVPTVNGLSLAESPAFKKAPGGAPANVAVAIARLGGSSAFVGMVGEDEFGYMLAEILKENYVNNSGMRFDPGARTALAFVTLRSDGEREFIFYRNPSADMLLHEYKLDLDLITKAKIFHYGSISLILDPSKSAHIAAVKSAKEAGAVLSYVPNLRLALWPSTDSAREGIMSIWETAVVIKISEEEISFLTNGEDPYDDAVVRILYHPNLKLLLVTEGSKGCRYYTNNFSGRVKGLKVDAVDTTGAGDAFVAGLLSQLASGFSLFQDEERLHDALRFANACGAITVTARGVIPALPTVLDAMLRSAPVA